MLDKGFQRVWYQRGNWLSLTIKLPTLLNRQSDITLESRKLPDEPVNE